MDRFHFFKIRRYENDDKKRKTKRSFLKMIVFLIEIVLKNGRFQKQPFLKS